MEDTILVVNCGSSTLKLAVFDGAFRVRASGLAERLHQGDAVAHLRHHDQPVKLPPDASHREALEAMIHALVDLDVIQGTPSAVGHRVVHGGETFHDAVLIDEAVIEAIEDCASLAPLHNPVNLSGIRATRALFPSVPHIAVFDTAFHQTLPRKAYLYALPYDYYRQWGVRRYGFHGTSHQFMLTESAQRLGKTPATTSIISAHLGNGCSIAAIRDGISVDTSMGLTPLEGLVMGSRSGDIDPGLFDFLKTKGIDQDQLHHVLNHKSGLLGLSGQTNDMRTLCELADHGHEPSLVAVEVFCYRLARYIGAMMASLDRLDGLVFTGGIGENSARVRKQTLDHLRLSGLCLNAELNQEHGQNSDGYINDADSRFPVLVVPTNEELVIARESQRIAASQE
ncbi:acetate/propionate kinase [Marinobacter santoriniensis NKSG1]|uniref:Acetate kinase n=1 Tax=Marinobacter santoriniensis NKSG1 TaxID=1288826 RepID=M7D7F1_9GAMM|nr:acetate kinase [Marinobacter santoriniensis]EMP56673.1 acetate/propionate kinase [Marinobacter santoriniensis NKSG1]